MKITLNSKYSISFALLIQKLRSNKCAKSPLLRASLLGGPTILGGYNVVTSSKELDTYGKAFIVIS